MCEDRTGPDDFAEHDAALARRGLSRRQFGMMGAAAFAASCTTMDGGMGGADDGAALTEGMVDIATPDGTADAFFVHPAEGRHPAVLLWPDVAGLREAFKVKARKFAQEGYAVLAVNHYYRNARAPILETFSEWRTPEGSAKIEPMRQAINPARTTTDARAFIAWLDAQPAVDTTRGIGTQGYCMGGPYTVRTAAAVPARVRAAASLHGGGLVVDESNSPHRILDQTQAAFLFAIAQNDDAKDPSAKTALREAADAANVPAVVEVYPADHGWTVIDSPAYDAAAANRAVAAILSLYDAL
ncbi:dienelactone hydrolase family protein [uncultured Croceicoccus sp.]|uniref:dienelactone hydrolase family protein n=1 Tax=uncultured Croceicoccus sp. TaxID=1295329 RepID=UPI0026141E76|nr:dienelactone hydrolase family protein [uncultured Croceicoccus sp.]